jgi:hypothetical protein
LEKQSLAEGYVIMVCHLNEGLGVECTCAAANRRAEGVVEKLFYLP